MEQLYMRPVSVSRPKRSKNRLWITLMTLAMFLSVVLSASVGTAKISPGQVCMVIASKVPVLGDLVDVDANSPEMATADVIVSQVRLPRIVLALLVGMALSVSGVIFQGLFRNPLADPYMIGVSSGASLGAAVGILLQVGTLSVVTPSIPLFAFIGAVMTMVFVYLMASERGTISVETFLLSGVVIGSFISAIVSFIMVMAGHDMPKIAIWLMGNLSSKGWDSVVVALPYIAVGTLASLCIVRALNLIAVGEEPAKYMGLDVETFKKVAIALGSLTTAVAVSCAGVIGFVGLIVPHVSRMIVGPDHRALMPMSIVTGATFMVVADTIARTVISPVELPVGIITAIAGTPFFFILMRKRRSKRLM